MQMTPMNVYYSIASVFLILLTIGLAVLGVQIYKLIISIDQLVKKAHRTSDKLYLNALSAEAGVLKTITNVFRFFGKRKGGDDNER
jgi:hypothetical protein